MPRHNLCAPVPQREGQRRQASRRSRPVPGGPGRGPAAGRVSSRHVPHERWGPSPQRDSRPGPGPRGCPLPPPRDSGQDVSTQQSGRGHREVRSAPSDGPASSWTLRLRSGSTRRWRLPPLLTHPRAWPHPPTVSCAWPRGGGVGPAPSWPGPGALTALPGAPPNTGQAVTGTAPTARGRTGKPRQQQDLTATTQGSPTRPSGPGWGGPGKGPKEGWRVGGVQGH